VKASPVVASFEPPPGGKLVDARIGRNVVTSDPASTPAVRAQIACLIVARRNVLTRAPTFGRPLRRSLVRGRGGWVVPAVSAFTVSVTPLGQHHPDDHRRMQQIWNATQAGCTKHFPVRVWFVRPPLSVGRCYRVVPKWGKALDGEAPNGECPVGCPNGPLGDRHHRAS